MKYKANYDIILPDGKKIESGTVFEHQEDASISECCTIINSIIGEDGEVIKEKSIREVAKELGIKSYHLYSEAKLIEKIEEVKNDR